GRCAASAASLRQRVPKPFPRRLRVAFPTLAGKQLPCVLLTSVQRSSSALWVSLHPNRVLPQRPNSLPVYRLTFGTPLIIKDWNAEFSIENRSIMYESSIVSLT